MQYLRRGTVQEVFSTFASIAVWAAVRFVLKSSNSNSNHHQQNSRNMTNSENHSGNFYAFLPLITDPGDEARNRYYYAANFNFFFIIIFLQLMKPDLLKYLQLFFHILWRTVLNLGPA